MTQDFSPPRSSSVFGLCYTSNIGGRYWCGASGPPCSVRTRSSLNRLAAVTEEPESTEPYNRSGHLRLSQEEDTLNRTYPRYTCRTDLRQFFSFFLFFFSLPRTVKDWASAGMPSPKRQCMPLPSPLTQLTPSLRVFHVNPQPESQPAAVPPCLPPSPPPISPPPPPTCASPHPPPSTHTPSSLSLFLQSSLVRTSIMPSACWPWTNLE